MDVRAHYLVVDGFLAAARPLRAAFEARFAERLDPFDPSRFVWEYWHVPDQFSQHRAPARTVFPAVALVSFERRLLSWASGALGLSELAGPLWVSFLLDGDFQALHRDTPNGTFAFTFGLSRPGRPRFTGGETLLARPELLDYWRLGGTRPETAADPLFEAIPSVLNRLVAFDARVPHAVRTVQGPRHPRDGRLAIQGWLAANGCVVSGGSRTARDPRDVDATVRRALRRVPRPALVDSEGLLAVRLQVSRDGRVRRATTLACTLVPSDRAARPVLAALARVRFAPAAAATAIVVPAHVTGGKALVP